MKRVWAWLKDRWHAVVALVVILAAYAGWQVRRKRLGRVQDELAVARAKAAIVEYQSRRAMLEEFVELNAEAIAGIDEEIRAQREAAVRAHELGKNLKGRDLELAFAELGF